MPHLELVEGRYLIKFEPRTLRISDARDGREHERGLRGGERCSGNQPSLYDTFLSPGQGDVQRVTAQWLRLLKPERLSRYSSPPEPALWPLKMLAEMVRAQRRPASPTTHSSRSRGRCQMRSKVARCIPRPEGRSSSACSSDLQSRGWRRCGARRNTRPAPRVEAGGEAREES